MEDHHSSSRAEENRAVPCKVNPTSCSEHTSSERLTGISRLEQRGSSWHLMERLCIFSCEYRSTQQGEFPARLQPLYWEYLLTTPQPSKHSKTGKRRTLAADQQDIFTVEDSICYLETVSLSSRMFGNPGRQHIPLYLSFSEKSKFGWGWGNSRWRIYLCVSR